LQIGTASPALHDGSPATLFQQRLALLLPIVRMLLVSSGDDEGMVVWHPVLVSRWRVQPRNHPNALTG
jgi:hypothetical protein